MPGSMFSEMEPVSEAGGENVSSGGGGGGSGGGTGTVVGASGAATVTATAAGTEEEQKSLRLALDHLSILGLGEEGDGLLGEGGGGV
ncbi:RNA-binding protein MEX3B-like, partial [Hemiscyllium ocellatum]|uniref:RNA-binding protein MEX3B-like n=1 Tax=Hemiscyllium ocellatum TaxID=170820 RepID=UPI00296650F0